MKTMTKFFAGGIVLAMAAGSLTAAPLLDWQDGSAGYTYDAWSIDPIDSTYVSPPAALVLNTFGGAGTSMGLPAQQAISITGNTTDPAIRAAVFSTTAFGNNMNDYEGSGSKVAGLQFDFYSGSGAPSKIGFFLEALGGSVWYYDVTPVHSSGWQTYGVSFGGSGWYGFTDSTWSASAAVSLDSILGDVEKVGMYVYFNPNQTGQDYGVGTYGLTVPEPETYVVIGIALLSVAFIFRRKITDSLAEARAMVQM